MELADMQDLGSCAAMRWGSNPHARTKKRAPDGCPFLAEDRGRFEQSNATVR